MLSVFKWWLTFVYAPVGVLIRITKLQILDKMNKENETSNNSKPMAYDTLLANVIYPTLDDMRHACRLVANNIDELTPMLTKEEQEQFKRLASKWMYGLREHKKQVIDGMIDELSS